MVGSKAVAALGALAVTMALAACGGSSSSGVSAAAYVKSICQAVGPFEKDVQTRSQAISNLGSGATAAQGKKALQDFLSAVVADTDTAINKLKAAGTPNVNNGKTIGAAIVAAFTALKTALATADKTATTLPTTSPEAFKTAAQQLGSTITTSMGGIGSSLNNLKSADLEAAAKKEPACQSIGA